MESKHRQDVIMQLLDSINEIDALTVMSVINTDTQTITADFKELIQAGKIVKSSPGNYKKPFDTLRYLTQPLHLRERKPYNEELLNQYIANTSSLLGKDLETELSENKKHVHYNFRDDIKTLEKLYIDLSYNSNRLSDGEFDTLDTEILLKFGKSPKGKSFIHSQRILNYKKILDSIFSEGFYFEYNIIDFQNVHKTLMQDRIADSQKGEFREFSIVLNQTSYEPLCNPRVLENQFYSFIDTVQKIKNPVEKSFFIFVFLPYILPFSEGNAELARVVMNIPLIENNFGIVSFKDIDSEKYELAYRAMYELNDMSLLRNIFLRFFPKC